jgi:membrane protein DedA with SNARE-associated domain
MGDPSIPRRSSSFVPRNKYLAAFALVIIALSAIGLIGIVFRLPFASNLGGGSNSSGLFSMGLFTSLLDIGYAGLFVLMAMESSALPIPSEVVLPLAGYLVFLGKMNLALAIIDATVAGLVGSLVSYFLGLWLGRPVIYRLLRSVGVSSTHLDDGERWVDSKGSWSVFVGRFIPGVRSVISIPAGLLKMNLRPFVILTLAGSLVWSAVLIYAGYSAGPLWQTALNSLSASVDGVALVVVGAVSVLYLVYYRGPRVRNE